jgi:hypothetical protein
MTTHLPAVDERLDVRSFALPNSADLDAYRSLCAVVILGVLGTAIGTDEGDWWIPSTDNEWNAILWGLFIYMTTLPSALLAWRESDCLEYTEFVDA